LAEDDVHHLDVCKVCLAPFDAFDVELEAELGVDAGANGDGDSDTDSGYMEPCVGGEEKAKEKNPDDEDAYEEDEEEKAQQKATYMRSVRNNWLSLAREYE
jgi:fructose/tagatose bisphosphate aldolase